MILPSGFGLSMPHQNAETDPDVYDRALAAFNPPWFTNHKRDLLYKNYFRTLWCASWVKTQLAELEATPDDDKIWFIGNEPCGEWQGNETPQEFAEAIAYWTATINRPFAIPGILWGQHGYDWWLEYLSFSTPRPDAYHIHIYAANGPDWTLQLNQALTIFNDRPLIITECGGWGVVPSLQIEIQSQIYTAIAIKKIPSALWFSIRYGPWKSYWRATDCWTKNEVITKVGIGYNNYAHREAYTISLPLMMG